MHTSHRGWPSGRGKAGKSACMRTVKSKFSADYVSVCYDIEDFVLHIRESASKGDNALLESFSPMVG